MLKRYNSMLMALFYSLDILLSGAALWTADWLRHSLPWGKPIAASTVYLDRSVYLAMALIWGIVFRLLSFYTSRRTMRLLRELATVGAATLLSCMTLATWLFLFDYDDFSRLLLFYFGVLDLGILLNFHLMLRLFLRHIRARGYNLKKMLIIGAGETGMRVARALVERPWTGFGIVGFLDDASEKQGKMWARVAPVLGPLEKARTIVEQQGVDEVVIALPSSAYHRLADVVRTLQDQPVNIRVVPDLFSVTTVRPRIEDLWGIPLIGIRQPVLSGLDAAMKRAVDLIGSAVGLAAFGPVMLLTAVLIKLDSRGPVLFAQERVGENGRIFKMYKFRTMVANAEELLDGLVAVEELP
jgi:FlaA1/EpsC-like NDP-sugar epimerase